MKFVSVLKKLSAFMLTAVMIIGALQTGVSAENNLSKSGCRKAVCEVRYFSAEEKSKERKPLYSYSAPVYMSETAGVSGDYSCYSHLNSEQKSVYDKILNAYQNLNTDYFLIAKGTTNDNLVNDFKIVYVCIANDHPEIFWLGLRFGIDVDVWSNGTYDYYAVFEYTVETKTELNTKKAALNQKLNAIVGKTSGMTDYEKELFFHDYLCNNIEYDFDDWECYTSYGALVNGIAVCEGYAESMKMLCNACGIECLLVRGKSTAGEDHMWNMVKLPTGWYEVDVTWDDYYTGIIYNFFNTNDTEMNKSHIKSDNYVNETMPDDLGTMLDFNYYLPSTSHPEGNGGYLRGTVNAYGDEKKATEVRIYVKGTDTLFAKYSAVGNKTSYISGKIPAGEYTVKVVKENHAPLTVPATFTEGSITMNFGIMLLGDINGDSIADKKDLNILKKHINGTKPLSGYEISICDISGDGVADKKDLNRYKKHINGTQRIW